MTSITQTDLPNIEMDRDTDHSDTDEISSFHSERNRIDALEKTLENAIARHDRFLSFSLTLIVILLAIELLFADYLWLKFVNTTGLNKTDPGAGPLTSTLQVLFNLPTDTPITEGLKITLRIVTAWIFTIAIFPAIYYFQFRVPTNNARNELIEYKNKLLSERINSDQAWQRYLQEETRRLSHVISQVFLENKNRAEQSRQWLLQASSLLVEARTTTTLGEVQSLVTSINELVLLEKDELREQRSWRYMTVLIVIVYLIVLIASITILALTNKFDYGLFKSADGIPISILIWGAIGSLGAILYRFYTETRRVHFDIEARWLIARPIIGIIMGMIAYLAFRSGLILVTGGKVGGNGTESAPEFYWFIAFLAGFSDKFYIQVINLFVNRTADPANDGRDNQANMQKMESGEEGASNATPL